MIKADRIACMVFIFLLLFAEESIGQNFTAIGDWSVTVSPALISDAGEDYPSTFTSATNETEINITGGGFFFFFSSWRVDVRVNDINWNNQLDLYIRRTGGNPEYWFNYISGGTTYQLLMNTNQYFFEGRGRVSNITIQYQLSGVSVILPADNSYRREVVFTFTEL